MVAIAIKQAHRPPPCSLLTSRFKLLSILYYRDKAKIAPATTLTTFVGGVN